MIAEAIGALVTLGPADRNRLDGYLATIRSGGAPAAQAFLEAARLLGEAADPIELDPALPGPSDALPDRVFGMVAASFSAVSRRFQTRQDAQAVRGALNARADATIDAAGEAYGADLHSYLVVLVGTATVALSREAASRAPLVRVETGVSLPSSLLAFDLYGDPGRGSELVSRNDIATPMLMPVAFEAQAN